MAALRTVSFVERFITRQSFTGKEIAFFEIKEVNRVREREREVEPKSGGLLEFTAVPWENDHGRRLPRWPIVL